MDKKFFVPFKTAKLLKEKRYSGICDYYYAPDKQLYFGVTRVSNDTLDYENNGTIAAPTYHEVVDWLEGKGICVSVILNQSRGGWFASIDEKNKPLRTGFETYDFPTREEALNAAILKALEML